jgi:hypothetical protein
MRNANPPPRSSQVTSRELMVWAAAGFPFGAWCEWIACCGVYDFMSRRPWWWNRTRVVELVLRRIEGLFIAPQAYRWLVDVDGCAAGASFCIACSAGSYSNATGGVLMRNQNRIYSAFFPLWQANTPLGFVFAQASGRSCIWVTGCVMVWSR